MEKRKQKVRWYIEKFKQTFQGTFIPRLLVAALFLSFLIFLYGSALQTRAERQIIYKEALTEMEEGNFEDAIGLFDEASSYQNSRRYITYLQAVMFQEDGRYKEAARLFQSLGDFEDSSERVMECKKLIGK
jgi:tetratricopeptide (TPR) repeat protein